MNYINDYLGLNELKVFAFDTETYGLEFDTINLKDISFSDGTNSYYFDKDHLDIEKLKNVLINADLIIGHNLIFDLTVMSKFFGRSFLFEINNVPLFDTMLAQYILNENAKKGLKHLSETILGYKMQTYEESVNSLNKETWIKYSLEDSIQTFKLYKYFKNKVNNNKVFKRECKAILPIVDMQLEGFLVDKTKFKDIKEKMENRLKEIEDEFISVFKKYGLKQNSLFGSIIPINLNSPKQLKKFINNKLKIKIEDTSVKTLKNYKTKHKFFELLLDYRHIYKLYNSYIKPFEEKHIQSDGKIHASFNPTGTVTGRYSSSSPNLQQIPSFDEFGMRELFIADKGYKIACLDYAGQEIRLAAIISNDRNMKDALLNNKDIHLMTANSVYNLGIPSECLKTNHKDYKMYKDKFNAYRKKAKMVNFGVLYGAGAMGVSNLTGESEDKAQEMIDNFFEFYTGIKLKINKNSNYLYKYNEVINLFGRQRRFELIDSKAKRQSFNFLIQGTAGDMLKIDLYRVWNEVVLKYKDNIKLKATVHDEIIFMIKENMIDEILPQLVNIMQDFKFEIPIIVDYNVGNSYGSAH